MMIDDKHYEVFGKTYERPWFLTGLIGETKSAYQYARPEILDQRPIPELCAILAEHWNDEKLALKLLKQGDIVHLGKTLKESEFSGEHRVYSSDPRHGALWSRFIEFKSKCWMADHYGQCKASHIKQPKGQLELLN